MTMKNDKRRGSDELSRRNNPNERKHADSNRNRSDNDLFGSDEY